MNLALEAGFPAGTLNVVPGFGKVAGQALVDHPDVDKVTFTGSPTVGRQILQGAAGNLKRVTLELGGKSANIIFPDADIDAAVKAAGSGIFFNTGQVCSAGSRILAHADIYDEVVERLVGARQVDAHRRSARSLDLDGAAGLGSADEARARAISTSAAAKAPGW